MCFPRSATKVTPKIWIYKKVGFLTKQYSSETNTKLKSLFKLIFINCTFNKVRYLLNLPLIWTDNFISYMNPEDILWNKNYLLKSILPTILQMKIWRDRPDSAEYNLCLIETAFNKYISPSC